jgi:hypothetical protein
MTNENSFVCKKAFRHTAETGIAFHWLKCTFVDDLYDAVADAVCTVHLPAALAASSVSADKERVFLELVRSRTKFDGWMDLARKKKPMPKPLSQRIRVNFLLPLDGSDIGKTLAWLAQNETRSLTQHVLDAVLLLYLPVALSALADPSLDLALLRADTIFSCRMDLPGYPSPMGEVSKGMVEPRAKPMILLNPSQASSVEAQRPDVPDGLLDKNLLTGKDVAGLSDGAQIDYMPEIDMDYDF